MASARTYWFGPKRIGWGISPRTWQGWSAIGVYGVLMIGSSALMHHGYEGWDIAVKIGLTGGFFGLMIFKYDPGMV